LDKLIGLVYVRSLVNLEDERSLKVAAEIEEREGGVDVYA
jgi:hypothetical protein